MSKRDDPIVEIRCVRASGATDIIVTQEFLEDYDSILRDRRQKQAERRRIMDWPVRPDFDGDGGG